MRVVFGSEVAVSYVNKGDTRQSAYFCDTFKSQGDAINFIKVNFENNPGMDGKYIISFYDRKTDMCDDYLSAEVVGNKIVLNPVNHYSNYA